MIHLPTLIEWYPLIPELIIFTGAITCLLTDLFLKKNSYRVVSYISYFTIILAAYFLLLYDQYNFSFYNGLFELTTMNFPVKFLILLIVFLVLSISDFYLHKHNIHYTEFHFLILIATVSYMVVVSTSNLIMLVVALETGSFSSYILCGLKRRSSDSIESALKYFFTGAFATAFLLYGIALIYGASGSIDLNTLFYAPQIMEQKNDLFVVGVLLSIIGLSIKLAAAPFHFWSPEVYQGSPTVVTSFISTVPKIALIWLLVRMVGSLNDSYHGIQTLVTAVGLLSIVFGAVFAWKQKNIKAMLAFSSVNQVGYLITLISLNGFSSLPDIYFYLVVYTIASVGIFGCLSLLEDNTEENRGLSVSALTGLLYTNRRLAVTLCIFIASFIGLPLTAGFIGKFRVYSAVFSSGSFLATSMVLVGSLISVYYYSKIIFSIFSKVPLSGSAPNALPKGAFLRRSFFGIGLSLTLVIVLGVFPNFFLILGKITGV